jgi:hypothetical protein
MSSCGMAVAVVFLIVMSAYFRACAASTPELGPMTPEALAIIQGAVPPASGAGDEFDEAAEARGPKTTGILEPITVAFKSKLTDPRSIDTIIAQTRALLDAPEAEALRRDQRREAALQARELDRAAREAKRADEIDARNRSLMERVAAEQQAHAAKERDAECGDAHLASPSAASNPRPGTGGGSVRPINAEDLPVPVVIDVHDAFSRLRVEEARVRLDQSRKGPLGNSIIGTYVAQDIALTDETMANKAEQLSRYPPELSRYDSTPLHLRLATRRRESGGAGVAAAASAAPRKIGFTNIDEDEAERRAAERSEARLAELRSADGQVAAAITTLRAVEAAEREEQQRRFEHRNEQRRRVLDESRTLQQAESRRSAVRASVERQRAAATGLNSTRNLDDFGATLAVGSIIRARPGLAGSTRLNAVEEDEDTKVLRSNLVRQDRAEHPIDAYQRRVRDDMLRDRGYDEATVADINSEIARSSMLRLAETHARLRD